MKRCFRCGRFCRSGAAGASWIVWASWLGTTIMVPALSLPACQWHWGISYGTDPA